MTTWLCISPKRTMMLSVPWPFLIFLMYALLDKEPLRRTSDNSTESPGINNEVAEKGTVDSSNAETLGPNSTGSAEGELARHQGQDSDNDSGPKRSEQGTPSQAPPREGREAVVTSAGALSWREKIDGVKQISPYIFFLFVTYLAEYLANHAVITTLAFPSSSFSPRDHYPYYLLSYHVGKFLGRSHFFVVSTFFPSALPRIAIKKTWLLALLEVLHLVFFFLVAWYRFVTEAWIIILLCFTEGFTAGSMYVNSAHAVSDKIPAPALREFALCILTVGNAFGKLTAGFWGLFQEPMIRRHCLNDLDLGEYCFTRHAHHSAWERAPSCGNS